MRRGFTLIELVLVLGLLATLASMAAFATIDLYRRTSADDGRERVRAALAHARALAVEGRPISYDLCADATISDCGDPIEFAPYTGSTTRRSVVVRSADGTLARALTLYADGTIGL